MSDVNDEYYNSKEETYHGFLKVTNWSIAAIAIFLVLLAAAMT